MGDVILSTPAIECVKKKFPQSEVFVLVKEELAPLLRGLSFVDQVVTLPKSKSSQLLAETLKPLQLEWALVLQNTRWVSRAIKLARIPLRVGPANNWSSYFYFNQRVAQHRSRVEFHEAEYNLHLLKAAGIEDAMNWLGSPKVQMGTAEDRAVVSEWRKANSLLEPFLLIHPGMGGSARNWSFAAYQSLIQGLAQEMNHKCVVSIGPQDYDALEALSRTFREEKNVQFWISNPMDSLTRFVELVRQAGVVVAPSTGPLHLAAALGVATVGLFPPIRVQSAKRWGPYRPVGGTQVFAPSVKCPAKHHCLGHRCAEWDCMEKIQVREVLLAIASVFGQFKAKKRDLDGTHERASISQ